MHVTSLSPEEEFLRRILTFHLMNGEIPGHECVRVPSHLLLSLVNGTVIFSGLQVRNTEGQLGLHPTFNIASIINISAFRGLLGSRTDQKNPTVPGAPWVLHQPCFGSHRLCSTSDHSPVPPAWPGHCPLAPRASHSSSPLPGDILSLCFCPSSPLLPAFPLPPSD